MSEIVLALFLFICLVVSLIGVFIWGSIFLIPCIKNRKFPNSAEVIGLIIAAIPFFNLYVFSWFLRQK